MRDILRETVINDAREYYEILKNRKRHFIEQYKTPILSHIGEEDTATITIIPHIWKTGDKFYKLADMYYNEPKYWWLIAWFNKTPTESHVAIGEQLFIPLSLEQVMMMFEYK